MKILRLGGINLAASRFLDLLEQDEIEKLVIFVKESEIHHIKDIYNTARCFNEENILKKLEVKSYSDNGLLRKFIRKFGKITHSKLIMDFIYLKLKRDLKYYNDFDAVWFGDNDFDGSNELFVAVSEIFSGHIPIIRSYKETRFLKCWAEYFTLKNSDCCIFPLPSYVKFFSNLYGITFKHTLFADLDYRYSRTIQWVKGIKVKKLSNSDHIPHVCILTGRALSEPNERRSGERYYFIPMIEELLRRGIAVHLHALRIVPDRFGNNSYYKIAKNNKLLHVEKPLVLTAGSNDYVILKKYDAGILHPEVSKCNNALIKFQQINIPNRFYEYQIADTVPIVLAGAAKELERIISETNFGIIFNNYDDLANKLFDLLEGKINRTIEIKKIKSYKEFAKKLIQSIIIAKNG